MQIQVCRKCGNRNTVIKGALTSCNYCGSTDLEPITEAETPAGMVVTDEVTESGSKKWLWTGVTVLGLAIAGGAVWKLQQDGIILVDEPNNIAQSNNSSPKNNTINSPQTSNPHNVIVSSQNETEIALATATEEQGITSAASDIEESPKSNEQTDLAEIQIVKAGEVDTSLETTKQVSQKTVEETEKVIAVAVTKAEEPQTVVKAETAKTIKPELKLEEPVKVAAVIPKAEVKPIPKPSPKPKPQPKPQPKPVVKAKVNEVVKVAPKQQQEKSKILKENISERRAARITTSTGGVVIDKQTGLMWMQCSLGQTWVAGSCSGEANEYLWSEANAESKNTTYANYNDWRLPTRQELQTLVECSQGRLPYDLTEDGKMAVVDGVQQNGKCLKGFSAPTIDKTMFPNTMNSFYWSYSRSVFNNYSAWGVFFNKGYQYSFNTGNLGFVRLVRNAK